MAEANLYDILTGAAPKDTQTQKAIAEQLRRRRSFGELGALTGDRVLQPFGQQMSKQADTYAEDIQATRQKDIDNTQTKAYQDAQTAHMKELEGLTKRGQTLDHVYQMLMAQAAGIKAEKTGTPKASKLTYSDRNKLEAMAGLVNNMDESESMYKPEYSQILGPGPQSRLPNTAASLGIGSKGSKEAANWWSNWNLLYTLPQRNATFGATLTPGEKQSWTESDINPSMGPEDRKKRVEKILNIVRHKGALMNKTYKAQYDPELIDSYGLPGEEFLAPAAQGHGAGAMPPSQVGGPPGMAAPQPKRIRVDAQGNVIGN